MKHPSIRARMPIVTVRPIHFEDFDGHDFERLVFAYLLWAGWRDVAWYGQTGSDLGRDIIGTEFFDGEPNRRTVVQCVNRASLPLTKAKRDMKRAIAAPSGEPDAFLFVCRSNVSADQRDKVKAEGKALGIRYVNVWSGAEFEEQLRLRGEFLLKRMVDGIPFPDDGEGLRKFIGEFAELSEAEALALLALTFDRPAFWTPFAEECRLFDFQEAIENTIGALNAGIWKSRDGGEIRRLPSLQQIADPKARGALKAIVRDLDSLRRLFVRRLKDGSIIHCKCTDPHCGGFQILHGADRELDDARRAILARARAVIPGFDVELR